MATGEFHLIGRHLTGIGCVRGDVVLDVGDDAALLDPGVAAQLATAWSSAAVAPDDDAAGIAERCAEAAIAALAGQGATPAWLTLALTLEQSEPAQVAALARGVGKACMRHGVRLVGGDTTAGSTAITVFACGPLP